MTALRLDAKKKQFWKFDRATKRYVKGKVFASKLESQKITRDYIEKQKAELIELGVQFQQKKITIRDFRENSSEILKKIHIANAALVDTQLHPQDLKLINGILKQQLYQGSYQGKKFGLKFLTEDITKGRVSEKMLAYRLGRYADSGKISFDLINSRRKANAGKTQARRIRVPDEKSCMECIIYEIRGWVPISQLILPKTQCSCGSNCRCRVEYQ